MCSFSKSVSRETFFSWHLVFCEFRNVSRETIGCAGMGGKQQVRVHLLARIWFGGWALFAMSKGDENPEK